MPGVTKEVVVSMLGVACLHACKANNLDRLGLLVFSNKDSAANLKARLKTDVKVRNLYVNKWLCELIFSLFGSIDDWMGRRLD